MRHPLPAHRPHPRRARRALVLAVASERFAFGLLASLLVFHLSERWGLAGGRAAAWVGYFLSASYMTPLLGGLLCDRGLSPRAACGLGCLAIAVGYAVLASQKPGALGLGIACVLGGSGLFRPGVQLLLDRLVQTATPAGSSTRSAPGSGERRDEVYTWMHAAVNVGGMLAPLFSDGLQRSWGWSTVSVLAVACLLLSLLLITWGVPWQALAPDPVNDPASPDPASPGPSARQPASTSHLAKSSADSARPPCSLDAAQSGEGLLAPWALIALCASLIGFWMVYVQSSSTLLLWARDCTDRRLGSHIVPVSAFAALPWALVVVLTPPLLALFRVLRRHHREPDLIAKLRLGFLAMAIGFAALVLAALPTATATATTASTSPPAPAHMAWLALALLAITVGELCVAPLGPVLLLQVAPLRFRGLVMALWFGTLGVGMVAGGLLSELWGRLSPAWFFAVACGLTLLARSQLRKGFSHSENLDTLPARLCHG